MGLFDVFKKKADTSASSDSATATVPEQKMMTCEKCGKEKPQSEGNMVLEGSAFCCSECCPKDKKEENDHEVCEFC